MPVLGNLIKKAIELGESLIPHDSPQEAQHKVLKHLLKEASDTAFGKAYAFEEILESPTLMQTFAQTVPMHDYDAIHAAWWHRTLAGEANVTWPGTPHFFAVSSGTTSSSKRIPVTEAMLSAIRRSGIGQILALSEFDLPAEFFEKEILMLGSSTDLKSVDGHLEGEISGISAGNIPSWFELYYRPGKEISSIADWDKRVERIAQEAPKWDIGSLSGIPSWIELMLKRIIEYHQLSSIHDIWPNLTVYTSGGVALEPYKASLEKLTARPLVYIDTYLASEGFLAFQARPQTNAMKLVLNNGIYFEFVPFQDRFLTDAGTVRPDAPVLTIGEVTEGVDYVLLISTVAGAWRYMIGDTVQFMDVARGEIVISGRTKFYLNVVGEQLPVNKMMDAVLATGQTLGVVFQEFTVSALRRSDGEYINRWYLGSEEPCTRAEEAGQLLDEALRKSNKNYDVARSKALKDVEVHVIPTGLFHEWNEHTKQKGGQTKMPKVMKEEDFLAFEAFVQQHSL
ncbi:GH3 family domain-containing protein [Arundinibacter roseus]|uniref:GH3 auxin-responsive promoter n=1 Tax=Arundinibacter roseus TaxID=2070510 RepID=A0A4R4JUH4_9BACT|nr:GH3 auxin-responsive promoter family protein [Arundinibacter roseus]TDB58213.1 GH3 auxin-responsive promoter [Arundinibacter roseus]